MSTTMIPIGFFFTPTEEILINEYLMKKILGQSLPYEGIIERDLYGSDPPWQVLGDDVPWIETEYNKKCVYVFTCLKYMSATCRNRVARTAGCGSWMGKSVANIVDSNNKLIGKKEYLVYESSDETLDGTKGCWLMHEYALAGSKLDNVKGKSLDKTYVVCKITKHESKFLKIVPKKSVSRKAKTVAIKSGKKRKIDATKKGISRKPSSLQEFCSELENDIAKSGLEVGNVTKENEGSQEFETQYSQEGSSLTLPSVGIEEGGFNIQDYNEILYNYGSYGDDFFVGSNDMFNTDELLALLEADEPTKRQRRL